MKVVLAIVLTLLVLFGVFFYLTRDEYGKQCGGFAGETGELQCPSYLKCVYKDNFPDASGVCKVF